ncbi:MAG: sulfatase-like hydrolase/transferase [Saccharofermentans sp.]|nr:sulfatase-like hydrolase/transferase [Saccharofermentans sp.]
MSKLKNKNLICILEAILALIAYILIDGFGVISTGYKFIVANGEGGSASSSDPLVAATNQNLSGLNSSVLTVMKDLYVARMVIMCVVLFPILFLVFRYRIKFRNNDEKGIKSLINYFRPVFGFVVFYYILTIKTAFIHEPFTTYLSLGNWVSLFRIVFAFIVWGAFVIDWPVFFKSVKSFPSAHPVLFKAAFVLFISFCSCLLVEFQIGSKMNMATYMVGYNILYWLIIQVFIDVITRGVKTGAFVSLGLSYLIGLVNDIVYQFRGNFVMFGDLTVIRTAMEVAGKYTYRPSIWFWTAIVILVIAAALTIILKFPKHEKPGVKEIAIRSGIEIGLIACVIFTFSNGMIYRNVFGVGWDYNTNVKYTGYIPYFMSNMNAIKKISLENYDVQQVDDALKKASSGKKDSYKSPNIIFIQNEAFSDLSVVYDIKTNQDYMPYIRSLKENTRKGYLSMSVTGGPTANTEFEILLRSSLQFLPYGSVPYTQYVNADLPSVAEVLKSQPMPYHTVAYHPYYTSGYRRSEVYNHFGFDEIVFEDNFKTERPGSDLIREMLSDSADYKSVEAMYENWRKKSDAPWFCFNVTIQNHGGYTQDYTLAAADNVYVTNFEATPSINKYLSLIKVSDNAFRELIEYFSNCDEPTIIAMYGDHQPSFDDDANEVLNNHRKDGGDINNYYVPYVIWANYDIEEEDSFGKLNTLSTNYFASTVFKYAGIKLTDYDLYLLDLHERIPAITALGAWDSEGNRYASPKASPLADNLTTLEMIQYNLIFDDEKRLKERFLN